MKKLIATALAVVLVASFVFAGYSAQADTPSAKTAVASAELDRAVIGEWKDVLSTEIKVSGEPKDLVIAVTAECALATNVRLHDKTGSESQAKIMVRALVDNKTVVVPSEVVFADRLVKVKGNLNDTNAWFEIYMATRNANGFNFIAEDVGTGPHTITVQAKGFATGVDPAPEKLLVLIGNRTLVVNEVNLK